jgi:hypothetical protein
MLNISGRRIAFSLAEFIFGSLRLVLSGSVLNLSTASVAPW